MYGGQSTYGIPRRPGSSSSNPRCGDGRCPSKYPTQHHGGYKRNDRGRRCFNCNSKDHIIRDCDKHINLMQNVARKVSSNKKNVRKILIQLVEDFSEILEEIKAFFQANIPDSSSPDNSSSSEDDEDNGNGSDHGSLHFLDEDEILPENTGPSVDPEDF